MTYQIPAELMHTLIYSIVGAICGIGCYMVIWAFNDQKFKTAVLTRLKAVEDLLNVHDRYRAEHDEYTVKVDYLEKRVDKLESK